MHWIATVVKKTPDSTLTHQSWTNIPCAHQLAHHLATLIYTQSQLNHGDQITFPFGMETRTHKFLSLTTIRDPFQFQQCIFCNLMETQVTQNFSSLINIWESHNMSGSRFMCMTALQLLFLTNWKMIGIQALPSTTYVFQVHVQEFRNINNQVECSEGEKNEFIYQFHIKRYSNVYSYSVW